MGTANCFGDVDVFEIFGGKELIMVAKRNLTTLACDLNRVKLAHWCLFESIKLSPDIADELKRSFLLRLNSNKLCGEKKNSVATSFCRGLKYKHGKRAMVSICWRMRRFGTEKGVVCMTLQ